MDISGPLSQDEIDALLAGVEVVTNYPEKRKKTSIHDTQIVLIMYGRYKKVEYTSIHLFDYSSDKKRSPAREYCNKINSFNFLTGGDWIYATIVNENELTEMRYPIRLQNLPNYDDRSIQKIINGFDKQTLAKAMKSVDRKVFNKILHNMSKRAAKMLKEDMEYMGPIRPSDCEEAQEKLIDYIRHLEDTGEITLPKGEKI